MSKYSDQYRALIEAVERLGQTNIGYVCTEFETKPGHKDTGTGRAVSGRRGLLVGVVAIFPTGGDGYRIITSPSSDGFSGGPSLSHPEQAIDVACKANQGGSSHEETLFGWKRVSPKLESLKEEDFRFGQPVDSLLSLSLASEKDLRQANVRLGQWLWEYEPVRLWAHTFRWHDSEGGSCGQCLDAIAFDAIRFIRSGYSIKGAMTKAWVRAARASWYGFAFESLSAEDVERVKKAWMELKVELKNGDQIYPTVSQDVRNPRVVPEPVSIGGPFRVADPKDGPTMMPISFQTKLHASKSTIEKIIGIVGPTTKTEEPDNATDSKYPWMRLIRSLALGAGLSEDTTPLEKRAAMVCFNVASATLKTLALWDDPRIRVAGYLESMAEALGEWESEGSVPEDAADLFRAVEKGAEDASAVATAVRAIASNTRDPVDECAANFPGGNAFNTAMRLPWEEALQAMQDLDREKHSADDQKVGPLLAECISMIAGTAALDRFAACFPEKEKDDVLGQVFFRVRV